MFKTENERKLILCLKIYVSDSLEFWYSILFRISIFEFMIQNMWIPEINSQLLIAYSEE